MRSFVVLLSILVVGFLLRVTSLGSAPLGLQADEASFLFNTAAILQTGRDEDNQRGALFLTSLIDPKPALYSYLQLPFVAAFGPTTFASRLPSALLGVVSLYLAYLLVMRVTGRRSWGLGMAAVLALSPWHIMNSRATQEVILSLVLVQLILLQMLALGNWWQSRERLTCKSLPYQKLAWFFLWVVLAMYTYHAAKVLLVVFFTLSAGVAWMQQRDTRQAIKSGVVLLLVGAAFILTLASALTTEELPSSIRAFYLVLPLSFLVVLGGVWLARQERIKQFSSPMISARCISTSGVSSC